MTKKIYFPVESLVGLGHFNRSGKLVREMVKAGLDVTVASGSFVDRERFFAGAVCRDLPPIVRREKGAYVVLKPDGTREAVKDFNEQARIDERIKAHLRNIRDIKPDIVISEFWPFSRPYLDREMEAVFREPDFLRVASVRDVLDLPETPSPERDEWVVRTANETFDAVLVHGDPRFIPLSETFAAAAKITAPVIYTGYVVDDPPRHAGDGRDTPVVVSCGSGVEGEQMVLSILTAWQKLLEQGVPAVEALTSRPVNIVCGPRFEPEIFESVLEWTQILAQKFNRTISVEHYRNDFTALLARAAFSVSLAGYNTTLETLAIGVPAVMVPKYDLKGSGLKISTEQLYRLERLQKEGMIAYAHPEEVQDSKKFADILLHEFARQTSGDRPHPQLDFSGAENTVAAITRMARQPAL